MLDSTHAGDSERSIPPEPDTSRFQLIKDPKSVLIALGVMGLAALVVVRPLVGATKAAAAGELLSVAMGGVLYFSIAGMAFWLAWGKSHFLWRLVAVNIGLVLTCVALRTGVSVSPDVFAIIAFLTAIVAMGAALPKLWGVRRCTVDAAGHLLASSVPSNQFSMRDLFRWTVCVAVIASTIRWGGLDRFLLNPRMHKPYAFWATPVFLAAATQLSMWLMLRLRAPRINLITISVIAFGAAALLANQVLQVHEGYFFWPMLVVSALSLPFHFFFRIRGCRLVRNPQRLLAAQAEPLASVTTAS